MMERGGAEPKENVLWGEFLLTHGTLNLDGVTLTAVLKGVPLPPQTRKYTVLVAQLKLNFYLNERGYPPGLRN